MGIVVEASEVGNSVGNVGASHGGKILKGANSREIGNRVHILLLGVCWNEAGEITARGEWRLDWIAVIHPKASKELVNIMRLSEGDGVSVKVLFDLNAEEKGS